MSEISYAQLQRVCVCTNQDERQDCETVSLIPVIVGMMHRVLEDEEWAMVMELEDGREGGSPLVLPDFGT